MAEDPKLISARLSATPTSMPTVTAPIQGSPFAARLSSVNRALTAAGGATSQAAFSGKQVVQALTSSNTASSATATTPPASSGLVLRALGSTPATKTPTPSDLAAYNKIFQQYAQQSWAMSTATFGTSISDSKDTSNTLGSEEEESE